MRNLLEYPITHKEVIEYLSENSRLEEIIRNAGVGEVDFDLAKTALNVVKAASTIVQNDIGSDAAELLGRAFDSQNVRSQQVGAEKEGV